MYYSVQTDRVPFMSEYLHETPPSGKKRGATSFHLRLDTMDGTPGEAESSPGGQGSVLLKAGVKLKPYRVPNQSRNLAAIDLAALACLPPTTSSVAGSSGCPDGEAQGGAVPPARNEERIAHVQDHCSYDAMSATHSPSTSFSTVRASFSWKGTEEPSDSLTRLLIAAGRTPASSPERSFIRRGGGSREGSFLSRSTQPSSEETEEPSDSFTRLLIAARRSPASSPESSFIRRGGGSREGSFLSRPLRI